MHTQAGFARVAFLTAPVGRNAVLAIFLLAQLLVQPSHARFGELATVGYVLVVAALLPGLLTEGPVATALATRPMKWLGARSYSLYLCQVLAAWTVYALLPDLSATAMILATMAVGLMAADFLFRYVESPMIRVGAGKQVDRIRIAPCRQRERNWWMPTLPGEAPSATVPAPGACRARRGLTADRRHRRKLAALFWRPTTGCIGLQGGEPDQTWRHS